MKKQASHPKQSTTKSPSDAIFKTAKWCIGRGYSVIPVKKSDKRPLIKWAEYQKRLPTHEEIKDWYRQWPNANIALITGAISSIMIVDVDTEVGQENLNEFLPDSLVVPTLRTPGGGWHYYFKYRPGLSNKARVIDGVDVRTDGGYAVIPPSLGPKNKNYEWLKGLKITDVDLPAMPDFLFDILKQGSDDAYKVLNSSLYKGTSPRDPETNKKLVDNNRQRLMTLDDACLREGQRDQAIFHLANQLAKGRTPQQTTQFYCEKLASVCEPPFPKSEVNLKVKSAYDRQKRRETNISEVVDEFLLMTDGDFLLTDVHAFSGLLTNADAEEKRRVQLAVSQCLRRRMEDNVIEKASKKRGHYRIIQKDLEFLDLTVAVGETVDIWMPLNLNHIARIFPGNMIVVAGAPNCGKTAFMLSCCRYNMKHRRVRYLSSEMGIEEAADRIGEFDIPVKEWQRHWEFAERYDNFQDSLLKGKGDINIIDYLEQPEGEAYRASAQLTQIDKNLGDAIAIVALQKNRGKGRDTGVGGDQTLAKPRLYLAIDYGWMKIVKCKAFEKAFGNPNWMEINFKLAAGHNFVMDGDWARVEG